MDNCGPSPDWKKCHCLTDRQAYLCIIGARLGAPLMSLNTTEYCDGLRGFRGPSIEPPWCRDTPGSRTSVRLIGVGFPGRKQMDLSPGSVPEKRPPLGWKNYTDQTHSCPRDWRHSGVQLGTPKTSRISQHYIVLRGSRGASIIPPLCRGPLASRTINDDFSPSTATRAYNLSTLTKMDFRFFSNWMEYDLEIEWNMWQFSSRLWPKWNSIRFKKSIYNGHKNVFQFFLIFLKDFWVVWMSSR